MPWQENNRKTPTIKTGAVICPRAVAVHKSALIDMAAKRPATHEDFAEVHGVGAEKLRKYGAVFLAAINGGDDA